MYFPYAVQREYTPAVAMPYQLEDWHSACGLDRAVVVQPSPYGTSNDCLTWALTALRGRARGVAVVQDDVSPSELDALHCAGVRGLRINIVAGERFDVSRLARRLRNQAAIASDWRWHLQLYAPMAVIGALAPVISELPVPVVLDHFAGAKATGGVGQPGFEETVGLLRAGDAYLKLSAPQKLGARESGLDVTQLVRTLATANADRLLWGSDWPHTGRRPELGLSPMEVEHFHDIDDGMALDQIVDWFPAPQILMKIFVHNPRRLFD